MLRFKSGECIDRVYSRNIHVMRVHKFNDLGFVALL